MSVSSVPIGCCTDYTVAGKCTVDGNNNKEDKTREEADMTPSPFFPKSSKVAQKCPRVVQIHISSVFERYPSFGLLWATLNTFGKKRVKGHISLLPGLVLLVVLAVHSALAYQRILKGLDH